MESFRLSPQVGDARPVRKWTQVASSPVGCFFGSSHRLLDHPIYCGGVPL